MKEDEKKVEIGMFCLKLAVEVLRRDESAAYSYSSTDDVKTMSVDEIIKLASKFHKWILT